MMKGVWCYTMDPSTRWEYCDVQYCGMYRYFILTTVDLRTCSFLSVLLQKIKFFPFSVLIQFYLSIFKILLTHNFQDYFDYLKC